MGPITSRMHWYRHWRWKTACHCPSASDRIQPCDRGSSFSVSLSFHALHPDASRSGSPHRRETIERTATTCRTSSRGRNRRSGRNRRRRRRRRRRRSGGKKDTGEVRRGGMDRMSYRPPPPRNDTPPPTARRGGFPLSLSPRCSASFVEAFASPRRCFVSVLPPPRCWSGTTHSDDATPRMKWRT